MCVHTHIYKRQRSTISMWIDAKGIFELGDDNVNGGCCCISSHQWLWEIRYHKTKPNQAEEQLHTQTPHKDSVTYTTSKPHTLTTETTWKMPDKKVTVAAILTLSASRLTMSTMVLLVSLPGIVKSESGAKRSVTLPIITLITAYVPVDRKIRK